MATNRLNFTLYPDDSADIGYNDFSVSDFGDFDCEVIYRLSADQFTALLEVLGCPSKLLAEEYITEKFGCKLEKLSFCEFCDNNGIGYDKNVWIN